MQKDDVYFGTTDKLPAFKVSLHKSGIWRAAFVRSLNEEAHPDRAVKKWTRPPAGHLGVTNAVAVIISPIPPKKPFKSRQTDDLRIKWLSPALFDRVIMLIISIVKAGVDTDAILFAQDKLVGRLKKANGETVCLVAHERQMTDVIKSKTYEVKTNLRINVAKEAIEKESLIQARAMLLTADEVIGANNPPLLYDVGVGWENVFSNAADGDAQSSLTAAG